jgi:hypothetical protein
MAGEGKRFVMPGRGSYGYLTAWRNYTFGVPTERGLEMLKTAFCLVLASWMTACMMAVVYSREIAEFVFERVQ